MERRRFLELSACTAFAQFHLGNRKPKVLDKKVLKIDIDDVGRKTLSDWMSQGLLPSLSALIPQALSYTRAWALPLCSPTRGLILSGCLPHRTGNLLGRNLNFGDSFLGPSGTWISEGMPGRRVKLGKVHFMGGSSFPNTLDRGYDAFKGCYAQLNTITLPGKFNVSYYDWYLVTRESQVTSSAHQTEFNTSTLCSLAIQEVQQGTEFIDVSFHATHKPVLVPPPNDEPPGATYVGGTTWEEQVKEYAQHLDYKLGLLINEALANGYVVFLVGDNGDPGSGKGTYKETGLNVPFFVWGNGISPGSTDSLITLADLWKTVRVLRGAEITSGGYDSISLAGDLFNGEYPDVQHRPVVAVSGFDKAGVLENVELSTRAARNNRWKLIRSPGPSFGEYSDELYDLSADPDELDNRMAGSLSSEELRAFLMLQNSLPTW